MSPGQPAPGRARERLGGRAASGIPDGDRVAPGRAPENPGGPRGAPGRAPAISRTVPGAPRDVTARPGPPRGSPGRASLPSREVRDGVVLRDKPRVAREASTTPGPPRTRTRVPGRTPKITRSVPVQSERIWGSVPRRYRCSCDETDAKHGDPDASRDRRAARSTPHTTASRSPETTMPVSPGDVGT